MTSVIDHPFKTDRYRGRFAPSPTGALHFGSLVTAVASYVSARRADGDWLIRMDDLDRQREVPGSAEHIVRTLDAFGFEWHGSIVKQSERDPVYQAALDALTRNNRVFLCSCSRKDLASPEFVRGVHEEPRYLGSCRNGPLLAGVRCAVRFEVAPGTVGFEDEIQGAMSSDVALDCGDFVVKRRDGLFAYQLAVVVDDADQDVTHVVRGADLLNSTPRQLLLQQALGLPVPVYAHVPLATDRNGVKLSKSAGAGALDTSRPTEELWRALDFLRQYPPVELRSESLQTIWKWAVRNWSTVPLRGMRLANVTDRPQREIG